MRKIILALIMAGSLAAQHELGGTTYTKTDIDIGNRLYIANCIYCHGPDGDQIAGVDFTHAKFPRSRSDDDIVKILRNGIPGTGMPSGKYGIRVLAPLARSAVPAQDQRARRRCRRPGDHEAVLGVVDLAG